MKCKVHPYEHSPGVCASCLRERLFALVAAQNNPSAEFHRRPPPPPPPLVFPRSVSPHMTHRRSSAAHRHHQLFFSTPQVGPSFSSSDDFQRTKRHSGRFSLLKLLFGHDQPKVVQPEEKKYSKYQLKAGQSEEKKSWFTGMIRRKGKKSVDDVAAVTRRNRWVEKGMSPERGEGYSSDSSSSEGRRPMPTPMWWISGSRSRRRSHVGPISGFGFCMSPLGRRRGGEEGRSAAGSGGGSGPVMGMNGSRKLAHFGRFK